MYQSLLKNVTNTSFVRILIIVFSIKSVVIRNLFRHRVYISVKIYRGRAWYV